MNKELLKVTQKIHAPLKNVWQGLTDPNLIKQYFFGTQVETTWQKHSPIFFRGEWQGIKYEDKGTILNVIQEQHVSYSYWSSMSGTEDKPENYTVVIYDLRPVDHDPKQIEVTITQETSPDKKEHSEKNWKIVLEGLKKLVEANAN